MGKSSVKWLPLFLSNFLGVFNENLLKNSIIFISVSWVIPFGLSYSQLISVASAALIFPYLVLSPLAGLLAVKYKKKNVFTIMKLIEIPVMIIAAVAFWFQNTNIALFSLFIMGILACLYSPSKYSLIRDIGGEEGVSFGSGIFETMAFIGVLTGTIVASLISDKFNIYLQALLFIGVAIGGYLVTTRIKAKEDTGYVSEFGSLNPIRFLISSYKFAHHKHHLNSAVLGTSVFWLVGSMLQMNLVIHCKHIYHLSNTSTGIVMAIAAIGIAAGCSTAGKLSGHGIRPGLIPAGLFAMILLLITLLFVPLSQTFFYILIFSIAFSGGFVQVPSLSMIQHAPIGKEIGNMIGYMNFVTFLFIFIGAAIFSAVTYFTNENSYAVFAAILVICTATFAYYLLISPDFTSGIKQLVSSKS